MKYIFIKWDTLRIFLVFLFSIIILQNQKVFAQQDVDYSGTSAANFLKIGVGSRPMAMGDAAIATVNSPEALYWNVAALTRIPNEFSLAISTMEWLVDTRNSYVATAYKVDGVGSFGLDLQYLDYGKIEETTVYDQDGTGRFLSASDMEIGLGYARELTDRFSFGVKVKFINETIADASASAIAVDLGAIFQTSFFDNNLRFAAVLSNFGTKMQFKGEDLSVTYIVPGNPGNKQVPAELSTLEWDIPLLLRFGISDYIVNNDDLSLLIAFDYLDTRDHKARYNLGTEVGLYKIVYLRGGYKFNYEEVSYTIGFGMDFNKIIDYNLQLDYSFLNYDNFGSLNQFSLIFNL
jgi:hypothetical protein